jgi:hypothetical protein
MLKYHIQTVELTSGQAAVSFNSLPQNYSDLYITISGRVTGSGNGTNVTFNNDTSGYTNRTLQGNGSGPSSYGTFNRNIGLSNSSAETVNTFGSISAVVFNYSSSSSHKTYNSENLSENNGITAYHSITTGLWSNNAPITSVYFSPMDGTWVAGTSISLYGVRSGNDKITKVSPVAVGGTVTTSGGYTIHTFTSSGILSVYRDIDVEYLVVAGGGGGGKGRAGGGGAGGYLAGSDVIYNGQSYPILVGAGGVAGTGSGASLDGGNGGNSYFKTILSVGGGGGQGDTYPFSSIYKNGGSGGGANLWGDLGGTGIAGQGNNGGYSPSGYLFSGQAGGGGGAGAAGGNVVVNTQAGAGGVGVSWNGTFYAGGGGGGADGSGTPGAGGTGGGGAGSNTTSSATSGTSNTGGGGGGGWRRASDGAIYDGGAGGSGIVIVRYLTP